MSVGKGQAKAEVDGKGQVKAEADGASRPSDLGFKLFGRTIPVPSDGDSKTDSQGTKQRGMRPIASATESFAISSIQDAGEEGPHSGDETLQSEDESNVVCIPDELRSSSGSNDGCDEEKCNPGSITGSENSRMGGHGEAETKAEGNETEDEKKQEAEGLSTQEKVLKKPDKLVPCPRCDSLDTKFCYYNNYNVNQPRHFCKNCQRYWTAGGSLRNVPVGAGRRKNKHSALHQRPILTDGMAVRSDSSDVAQQQLSCSMSPSGGLNRHLKLAPSTSRLHLLPLDVCSLAALDSPSSSTILNFGQESGLCESMATTLDRHKRGALQRQGIVHGTDFSSADAEVCSPGQIDSQDAKPWHDQKLQVQNGISSATGPSLETDTSVKWRPVDKSECGSSVTCQTLSQQQVGIAEPIANSTSFCKPPANTDATLGLANSGPFTYLGGPWQYSYNISWNAAAATAMAVAPSSSAMVTEGIADPALFSTLVPAHAPANSSPWNGLPGSPWPGFPLPLMQSPIWGSAGWGGIMPWGPIAAAAAAAPVNPGLPSPTLGKHPRERPQLEDGTKGSLWIPKTLRIDDPGEAARSSIWATLGLGNRTESITSGGSFKAFQPKTQSKHTQEFPVQARHTNPAAMTRSITFQESG